MIICTPCKKEMTCVTTGKTAIWGGCHGYSGDEFRCDGCGATVLVTSGSSYHVKNLEAIPDNKKLIMT